MKNRLRVAVVMGGYSSEREISVKSGQTVLKHLPAEKYDAVSVIIDRDAWKAVVDGKEYPVDKNDFSIRIDGRKRTFDFVFNAIHGHPGEDGALLAYFEMLGIPHSSAGFDKMALTFNKMYTLSAVKAYGISVAPSVFLRQGDEVNTEEILHQTGLPVIVKPNRAGSSYGITKVNHKDELPAALESAFAEDNEVLVERFIQGREFSIGVIKLNGQPEVFPITEIIPEGEFFDYEAKYLGKSKEITPAKVAPEVEKLLRQTAARVYEVLDLDGVSRAEYILQDGVPYFLEINMVPGLTEASILPQQIRAAGKTLSEVFDEIIQANLP